MRTPRPPAHPQRGAFPLDLKAECHGAVSTYTACLAAHRNDVTPCTELIKAYLRCRMDHGLMEQDEFRNLGLEAAPAVAVVSVPNPTVSSSTGAGAAASPGSPSPPSSKPASR